MKQWPIHLDFVKARPEGRKGNYVAHYVRDGKHYKRALKTRRREVALKGAMKLEELLQHGTVAERPAKILISKAVGEFIAGKLQEGVAAKTKVKYDRELEEFAEFAAGQNVTFIDRITDRLFLAYRACRQQRQLNATGRPLHEKSLYTGCMIIRGFVRWCVRQKYLATNVLESVRTPKPPLHRHFAPDRHQVDAILANSTGSMRNMLATLAFTGMRSGELQMLRCTDVDLAGNWIHVQTLKAKLTRTRPIRRVPIHPKLRPFVEQSLGSWAGTKQLLFSGTGNEPIDCGKLNLYLQRVARSLGFPVRRANDGFVVHSLRHYFETVAVNSGVPQRAIDAWLGHSGDRSMGAVYYRLTDEESQNLITKVNF